MIVTVKIPDCYKVFSLAPLLAAGFLTRKVLRRGSIYGASGSSINGRNGGLT